MKLFKTIAAAFSMFSAVPMPRVEWDDDSLRYMLCAFPLVGATVGLALWGWLELTLALGLGGVLWGVGLCLLPVIVTGGVHLDGFCDTVDARASHADRPRKLAILEDSHVGAFAVIGVVCYLLAAVGLATALEQSRTTVLLLGLGCLLSRSFSGLCVVSLPRAKTTGLVYTFAQQAARRRVKIILSVVVVAVVALLVCQGAQGGCVAVAGVLTVLWYRRMALGEFGGVTGDLSGWFLQVCELAMTAALLLAQRLF